MITIADVVKHLLTMPQDMEVWETENGRYWPTQTPPGMVIAVSPVVFHGRKSWEEVSPDNLDDKSTKKVCVLLES